jgi:hypothetical protein
LHLGSTGLDELAQSIVAFHGTLWSLYALGQLGSDIHCGLEWLWQGLVLIGRWEQ